MHMQHMHISIDIIITALSFFITDFLLSFVFGVFALDGWHGNLSPPICQPPFDFSGHLSERERETDDNFCVASP